MHLVCGTVVEETLRGEKKLAPNTTLCTTNPIWTSLESEPVLGSEWPATVLLSLGHGPQQAGSGRVYRMQ